MGGTVLSLLLMWLIAGSLMLLVFWGTNVPMRRPGIAIFWVLVGLVAANAVLQSTFFNLEKALLDAGVTAAQSVAAPHSDLRDSLARVALVPGSLRGAQLLEWHRVATSSVVHFGWIPLFANLWFIALLGRTLEGIGGGRRLLVIIAAGLFLPAIAEGLFRGAWTLGASPLCGGSSGIVYALFGAILIRIPRARFGLAINTDSRFWMGALLLATVTVFTNRVGMPITETLLIVILPLLFFILQSDCRELWVAPWTVLAFKLFQDTALIAPLSGGVLANSVWRIGGGLAVGAAAGLSVYGRNGFRETWPVASSPISIRKRPTRKANPAADTNAAEMDIDAAGRFLARKVFVGDAAAVLDFYPRVILAKFPHLVLPETEQWALARLLASKVRDAEALHAYENLVDTYDAPPEKWDVWLTMATLRAKVLPGDPRQTRAWLEKFLQGPDIRLRDRVEAERLLAQLPPMDAQMEKVPAAASETQPDNHAETPALVMPGASPPKPAETLVMSRLDPLSFAVIDGNPTEPRLSHRRENPSKHTIQPFSPQLWKMLSVAPRPELDDEKLLGLLAKSQKAAAEERPSGAYGADPDGSPTPMRKSRLANIEGLARGSGGKMKFPAPAHLKRDAPDAAPPARPYGSASDAPPAAERPKMRLRSEARKQL